MTESAKHKEWLELAEKAEKELENLPRPQRATAIKRFADHNRVSANTVRRSIKALASVRRMAPMYGVPFESIEAPLSAVETLERIARLSPEDAGLHSRRALLGNISYGSLMSICEMLEEVAANEVKEPNQRLDLEASARRIKTEVASLGCYEESGNRTALSRAMRADLEFHCSRDERENVVAFVSPLWTKASPGCSKEDVTVRIMAASLAFRIVYFIAHDESEWTALLNLVRYTDIDLSRLKTILPPITV